MRTSTILLAFLLFASNARANDVQLFNPGLFGQPTSAAIKLLLDKTSNEVEPYIVKTDIKCGKYFAATIYYRGKATFGDIRSSLNKLYKHYENMKLLKEPIQASWRVEDNRFSIYLTQETEGIFKLIYIQFQSDKEMFKAMMKAEGGNINTIEAEFPDECKDTSKQ